MFRRSLLLMIVGGCIAAMANSASADNRVSASKKGSLLYFSKIELRWSAVAPFALQQDTFISIVNDYPSRVCVQWYFINGDAPADAVTVGATVIERAHPGWNHVNCIKCYTHDESTYMSANTGAPGGCNNFRILDGATPPGRPDPENPLQRVLRGYAVAFAVDQVTNNQLNWNHLSGHVDIVDYLNRSAWEYNAYAFACVAAEPPGGSCGTVPGVLKMDGTAGNYDSAFDKLLFDFYAVGSLAFSLPPTSTVTLDTDLTLYPVSVDLRKGNSDENGPVLTTAHFDIWNQNEDEQSGVQRCISCWDQTLLSNYAVSNSFLIINLQTNKGKARIDGEQNDFCDGPGTCCCTSDQLNNKTCFDSDCDEVDFDRGTPDRDCSEDAALLGVSDKILAFSGPAGAGRTDAGMTLVGQGTESATLWHTLIDGPDPLMNDGLEIPDVDNAADVENASPTPAREPSRNLRRVLPDKE